MSSRLTCIFQQQIIHHLGKCWIRHLDKSQQYRVCIYFTLHCPWHHGTLVNDSRPSGSYCFTLPEDQPRTLCRFANFWYYIKTRAYCVCYSCGNTGTSVFLQLLHCHSLFHYSSMSISVGGDTKGPTRVAV